MFNRRVVCGSLSLTLGFLAVFAPSATGAISSSATTPPAVSVAGAGAGAGGFNRDLIVGVALVGDRADDVDPASTMPVLRYDPDTGRTAYAFTDDHGARMAPAAG